MSGPGGIVQLAREAAWSALAGLALGALFTVALLGC